METTSPASTVLTITSKSFLTQDICEYELTSAEHTVLPAAVAGAHIGVETPSGAWRQYSLVNPAAAPTAYTIAIKRDDTGRGGSVSVHEGWQVGHKIKVCGPENNFALTHASDYLLIAGGIGITPIYAMAKTLVQQDQQVQMIYCTRSLAEAAYAKELQELLGNKLTLHHDNGDPTQLYDFWDHFEQPRSAHVFCCGPAPLMEEIKSVSGHWSEEHIHFEDFAGVQSVRDDDTAFEVTLSKSGRTITIPADKSILEALREAGVSTVSSCESGTCGTCKTVLIEGEIDHRDMVLMDDEKSNTIMICVSRAKTGGIILDL